MTIGRFLGGIAALIWNSETNQYLLLRRSDQRDFHAGYWECVTGRVDQGESYAQALEREVWEEVGVKAQIEFLIATTHMYRGAPTPENELLGVIFGCTITGDFQAQLSPEHSEMRWATWDQIQEFLPEQHWLYKIIHRTETLKAQLPQSLRDLFRREGFEM